MDSFISSRFRTNFPSRVYQLFALQRAAGMQLIEPSLTVVKQAEEIARMGTARQRHPSLQDSIYHALALEYGGVLVTADKKHIQKTQAVGAVMSLENWYAQHYTLDNTKE